MLPAVVSKVTGHAWAILKLWRCKEYTVPTREIATVLPRLLPSRKYEFVDLGLHLFEMAPLYLIRCWVRPASTPKASQSARTVLASAARVFALPEPAA